MPAFTAESSIEVKANIETVRTALNDFKTWPVWSPWIYVEPTTKLGYFGQAGQIGTGNTWDGEKVGQGKITLTKNERNRLECDLEFLKPFKSQADVYFDLAAIDDNTTTVIWGMNSSLPFFMFWMTGKMSAMITADYRRGLLLFKDYIELDSIPSKSTFDGIVQVEESHYIGLHGDAAMDKLSEVMPAQFETLNEATEKMQKAEVFTLCNRLDIQANRMDYTAAIGVDQLADVDAPLVRGTRAACSALKVTHVGPYRHLSNGWSQAVTEQRHGKHKMIRRAPPFEVYKSDPRTTDEKDLITEIFIPIEQ